MTWSATILVASHTAYWQRAMDTLWYKILAFPAFSEQKKSCASIAAPLAYAHAGSIRWARDQSLIDHYVNRHIHSLALQWNGLWSAPVSLSSRPTDKPVYARMLWGARPEHVINPLQWNHTQITEFCTTSNLINSVNNGNSALRKAQYWQSHLERHAGSDVTGAGAGNNWWVLPTSVQVIQIHSLSHSLSNVLSVGGCSKSCQISMHCHCQHNLSPTPLTYGGMLIMYDW